MLKRSHVIIAITVVLTVLAVFMVVRQKDVDAGPADVIKQAGEHVVLPTDERPAVMTVTDRAKLQSDFLRQAHNGDKVLVYQKHKKAIIYRPSVDKVVDIGPVVIDTPRK